METWSDRVGSELRFSQVLLVVFGLFPTVSVAEGGAVGPLRVCAANPRYFERGDGMPILLTGSHVWYNLVDMGATDPPLEMDYDAYLRWMRGYNHNFMRMWRWELTRWKAKQTDVHIALHPWQRTGEGLALDGKPRFDLSRFDEAYFLRLRSRVEAAGQQGIYVSIMLFEGWGLRFCENGWQSHPFHPGNNVNDTGSVLNLADNGLSIFTLAHNEITTIQEAYVKRVIETVNDLDNVLYEICNENTPESTEWQYHMIQFVHAYERTKPKQHPVGMTFQYEGGTNKALFESPADWISPGREGGYRDDPPLNDGGKVILNDTDHLWGVGGNQGWVWKSLLRGLNPIFMDPYGGRVLNKAFNPQWEGIRKSMGLAREIAGKINLARMEPARETASTGYCLQDPGNEYLVYLPFGGEVKLDLAGFSGAFRCEWFNASTGERSSGGEVGGSGALVLRSPFGERDALLLLERSGDVAPLEYSSGGG